MKICAWVTIYVESARDELDINEKTIAFNKIDRVFFIIPSIVKECQLKLVTNLTCYCKHWLPSSQ